MLKLFLRAISCFVLYVLGWHKLKAGIRWTSLPEPEDWAHTKKINLENRFYYKSKGYFLRLLKFCILFVAFMSVQKTDKGQKSGKLIFAASFSST